MKSHVDVNVDVEVENCVEVWLKRDPDIGRDPSHVPDRRAL
jgi:hypothetical protein